MILESLPPNWQECVDESGNTYYFNSETQETTWERPVVASSTVCILLSLIHSSLHSALFRVDVCGINANYAWFVIVELTKVQRSGCSGRRRITARWLEFGVRQDRKSLLLQLCHW